MALESGNVILPGRGLVLLADPHTAPPDRALFDVTNATTFTGWDPFHTSKENNVALAKEGGESETKGSWWTDDLDVTRSAVSWSVTAAALQVDATTLAVAFPAGRITTDGGYATPSDGGTVAKAWWVYMKSGSKSMSLYFPNVSTALGDAPEIDAENFFEIQLLGNLLGATSAVTDSANVGDTLVLYPPTDLSA